MDMDDDTQLWNFVHFRDVDVIHSPMKITIKYKGESIIDLDNPSASGNGLWLDYLACLEKYMVNKRAVTLYGYECEMSMTASGDNELKFCIYSAHFKEALISVVLPELEFVEALLSELKHIWTKMEEHGLFETAARASTKNIGLGADIFKRIEQCELHIVKR
ncbi:hypothetical protein [Paenibacillus sp. PL91]|uniref:hypothetical protein n=1 Tax=Paenibacillus sp. PL91 TaxID=2729538 RepID=UPI00165A0647|nr:hypothetical protein [Paenibacillus sp. PL91]MBC9201434.1 hypothetical protein [Paenibacillus sp. PL91]